MGTERSRPARTTLVEVARAAGVSVATASNALTGRRPVGDQTRKRVQRAARQLDYEPNQVARALVSQRTQTIGLVIPDVANPFFAELVRGTERALASEGFSLLIGDTDNDSERQRQVVRALLDRQVDGLMVVPASGADLEALELARRTRPTVLVDRTLPGWLGDAVVGDSVSGMQAVVDHLVELGHRRIAYVTGDLRTSTAQERFTSFTARLAHHGAELVTLLESDFTLESIQPHLDGLFAGPRSATAICAADDLLALAVLDAARSRGLHVPRDLSLTGHDDVAYARLAWPKLTTVRLSASDLGELATRVVLEGTRGDRTSQTVRLRTALVVRDSTAPAGQEATP